MATEVLTAEQLAAEWHCTVEMIHRLCRTGKLRAFKAGGWRVTRPAIDAYTGEGAA